MGSLEFLYNTVFGRACLKVATTRTVSNIVGVYMRSPLSKHRIKRFIKKNNIDMSMCIKREFTSFNDFFTRSQYRTVDSDSAAFVSPCDSRLSAYSIDKDRTFQVKNSVYTVSELVENEKLAAQFDGGYCLVFRLCVDDYHRYCYIDSGSKGKNNFIAGVLHTVQPIALAKEKVFCRNCREYTVLHTDNFGDVVQIEVGAMCVGRIKNFHGRYSFKKGEQKGMFEFGGSTVILLVKKNVIDLPQKYLSGVEVRVKYGEKIADKH